MALISAAVIVMSGSLSLVFERVGLASDCVHLPLRPRQVVPRAPTGLGKACVAARMGVGVASLQVAAPPTPVAAVHRPNRTPQSTPQLVTARHPRRVVHQVGRVAPARPAHLLASRKFHYVSHVV